MSIDTSEIKSTGKDFLDGGSPLAKDNIHSEKIPLQENQNTVINSDQIQVQEDIITLTKTELKEKYQLTYTSWKDMKQRCKTGRGILSQELESFQDFLSNVGHRKHQKYTLDRIDNDNRQYSPDNVEWRDKHAQNSNRSNNIILTHNNGESHTIAQWARITRQNQNTLYKRKQQGWLDMEIITGERDHQPTSPLDKTPWPYRTRLEWEKDYQKSITSHGTVSRMQYLNDCARDWLRSLDHDECLDISCDAEDGDLEAIKKIQQIIVKQKNCQKIVRETSEQINYDHRLKFHAKNARGNKNDELSLFKITNPRPPYMLNKKPVPN